MADQSQYMDEFLDDPKKLAEELRRTFNEEVTNETMAEEERKDLEEALSPPTDATKKVATWLTLRGEGGSGEMRRSVEQEMEQGTDVFGRDLQEVRDEEPSEREEKSQQAKTVSGSDDDHDDENEQKGDISIDDVLRFVEERFSQVDAQIANALSRLSYLEQMRNTVVPLTRIGPGEHVRTSSSLSVDKERFRFSPSPPKRGVRARSTVSLAAVEQFLKVNREYPVVKKIRMAKLQYLATSNEVSCPVLDISVSNWNAADIAGMINRE